MAAAALLLWLWAAVPMALGQRTLFLRDVFTTHVPLKAFGAQELRQGRIPAFDTAWALGQPFRGNPNALPFYPGNLLYLVLPFWSAFNLHYALHWLLAALTMAALARTLGQGPAAALTAGAAYAGSGWMLSGLTFYNLLAVSAWWPLVLLGAARGGRRGIAIGGGACGLALLAGEPVTATLGLVPLLFVAIRQHGFGRGFLTSVGIGVLGLLIALPQIVATARVLGFTSRGALGAGMGEDRFHLAGARLLELIVPFPFGLPWELGKTGYFPWDDQRGLPYVITLHVGIAGLWLACLGARRARGWAAFAVAGVFLAWAGAFGGDALSLVTGGMMRYPEKLLFWFALAMPLLAGWGLERAMETGAWKPAAVGAGLALLLAGGVFAAGPRLAAWLADRVSPMYAAEAPPVRIGMWIVSLLLAAAFLALAALAARRRSGPGLAAAHLAALLPLAGLVATAPVDAFNPSPWIKRLPPGAAVVTPSAPDHPLSEPSYLNLVRLRSYDLGPAPGVLHGLSYPLAKDLDGTHSPMSVFLSLNLEGLDGDGRANWMRALGVQAAVMEEMPLTAKLRLVDEHERFGGVSRLFLVTDPAPAAWWPRSVTPAVNPPDAFRIVSLSPDPVADVAAARPVSHHPGARVKLLRETPDLIEAEVSGGGGLLVLRRTWQPLYGARSGDAPLATLPVNLSLLGVEVPPGTHRVRVEVSSGPEKAAGVVGLLAFLFAFISSVRLPRLGTPRRPS
ncbi:MAG TPA: hypothetical protein VF789_20020 [Thermoanaerobaculia bacterium]